MRFLLVQPLEKKDESKQVLERLQITRRTGFCVSREGIRDGWRRCRRWKLSPSSGSARRMLRNSFQEDNTSKSNKPLVIKYFGGRMTVFKDMLGHFFSSALECSYHWNVDRDQHLHLLFLVLLTELSQKEEKGQDGAQLWIDISQNQGLLEWFGLKGP